MELNVNVNVTFQRNKLLSLSGMYNGEYMSAPQYTPIADLTGAGFHGGYNHIVIPDCRAAFGCLLFTPLYRTHSNAKTEHTHTK